jgi:hypothetical protein
MAAARVLYVVLQFASTKSGLHVLYGMAILWYRWPQYLSLSCWVSIHAWQTTVLALGGGTFIYCASQCQSHPHSFIHWPGAMRCDAIRTFHPSFHPAVSCPVSVSVSTTYQCTVYNLPIILYQHKLQTSSVVGETVSCPCGENTLFSLFRSLFRSIVFVRTITSLLAAHRQIYTSIYPSHQYLTYCSRNWHH